MATEVRERERELAAARDAAEAANRAKSTFLTNMSHEVRTPLNGVIGVAGVLGSTPLADEQRKMLGVIQNSAQVLQRVLNDVLDLARVEAGRLEIASEAFNLGDVVTAIAEGARAQCAGKGLGFTLEAADDAMGWVEGDPLRLQQILGNLIGNAVKFTERGAVTLAVSRAGPERVRFEVRDTGVGFDAATASQLFKPFQQADGSLTRKYGGSGLGLSISRELARAMGGEIDAAGAPGEGATFAVDLPLRPIEAAPPEAVPTAADADAAHGLRILVADDHPTNRQVVQLILASLGVEVATAENGAEAVAAYEAGGLDLVLMDMQMPVMDGLTAIGEIRRLERARGGVRLPILVLSANAMPEHVAAAAEAGADGHVAKPITPEQLIAAIEHALEGGAAAPADVTNAA
jgi:CheY-like chemotaxis protein/nitrogen-specific signal transduction histidine kinase